MLSFHCDTRAIAFLEQLLAKQTQRQRQAESDHRRQSMLVMTSGRR